MFQESGLCWLVPPYITVRGECELSVTLFYMTNDLQLNMSAYGKHVEQNILNIENCVTEMLLMIMEGSFTLSILLVKCAGNSCSLF